MSSELDNGVDIASKSTLTQFILFWIGQLFSIFGSSVVFFSVLWFFTNITVGMENQGTIFTTVSAIVTIPGVIIMFFSGVLIDRWNRKKIILWADSIQAFMSLLLVVLFLFFGLENLWPWNLILVTGIFMVRQTCQSFHRPAIMAIIPLMIPKDKISRFNGMNQFIGSALMIAGPFFANFLIGLNFTFSQILWIDVITFGIALIPTIFIKIPSPKKEIAEGQEGEQKSEEKKPSYFQEFKEGFRTIMDIKGMAALFIVIIVLNFISAPFNSLQYIYFQQILGPVYTTELAINGVFFQVAIFVGAGLMMLRKKWKRKSLLIIGSQFLSIIAYYLYALVGFGNPIWFIYISSALVGVYASIYNTTYQTIFHETIPPDKLGRVFSVDFAISFVLGPIATFVSGPLADWLGLQNLYMGIAIFAALFLTLMTIFSDYRHVGKDTLEITVPEIAEVKEGELKINIESDPVESV